MQTTRQSVKIELGRNKVGPLDYRWALQLSLVSGPFSADEVGRLDYYRAPIEADQVKHVVSFEGAIQILKLHRWDTVKGGQCLKELRDFHQTGVIEKPHLLTGYLLNLWEDWGGNDQNPGCFHQRTAGWKLCPGHRDLLRQETCSNQELREPYDFDLGPRYYCAEDKIGEPCETCGYHFAATRLYRPLPAAIVRDLQRIIQDPTLERS